MAQEIVTWCDVCLKDDEVRNPGTTRTASLDGSKVYAVDLCEGHAKELFDPLLALLREEARTLSDVAPREEVVTTSRSRHKRWAQPIDCPLEGCPYNANARGDLRRHMRAAHGMTLAAYETTMGHTVDGKPLKHQCPVCPERFSHGAGLGSHIRTHHPDYEPPGMD